VNECKPLPKQRPLLRLRVLPRRRRRRVVLKLDGDGPAFPQNADRVLFQRAEARAEGGLDLPLGWEDDVGRDGGLEHEQARAQGLTLVHFPAQSKRNLWDKGAFRGCLGRV